MSKGIRIMLVIFSILLSGILLSAGIIAMLSPGKPEPFLSQSGKPLSGSISEKIHVRINGIEQGMFIKSKDSTNPVLLYLHGGMPDYFLTKKYPTGLEEIFTIVWWEQRGSGISYSDKIPPESMTEEQMISDVLGVTNYLRSRFGKEKIYLMGHSGGTFIGIQAAEQYPELYYAYIGMAQMSDQLRSEKLAHDYMIQSYKERGDRKMVRRLENAPVTDGTPDTYLRLRDKAMHELGVGTTHSMKSVITGIFIPSLTFREYTFIEKINMWRGKSRSGVSMLWNSMLITDLSKKVPKLDIPVYFFQGRYDYTCSFDLAKKYFEILEAPLKGFYTFEHSAHSPIFEEPQKMQQILRDDVLKVKNNLADTSS